MLKKVLKLPTFASYRARLSQQVSDPRSVISKSDVVIDFTFPQATVTHALIAAECAEAAFVAGTTGLTQEQEASLAKAAESIPLVYAPNMSLVGLI